MNKMKWWFEKKSSEHGRGRKQTLSALLFFFLLAGMLLAGCTKDRETHMAPGESREQTEPSPTTGEETEPAPSTETIEAFVPQETEPQATEPVSELPSELPSAAETDYNWIENMIIGSDLHYLSPSLTDGGQRFQEMVEHGDGKMVTYIDEITDAFFSEVMQLRPNVLILSGDLTLDGEKASHEGLAQKLRRVEQAGIPVLVIPGNHDINNRRAARFEGTQRLPAEYTTPEEFREIYREFGYDEAVSEDAGSLSYVYALDENTWLLMLDTCQYKPVAQVGGAILSDTYDWIEKQLEQAWDEGVEVIPVAHHNLLDESEIYVDDCTIEHGEQLVEILEEWDVKLFLSGHLHVQHSKQSDEDRGIWEMVTSSLATPVCQYGVLTYRDDGSFFYRTWSVDVERWAAGQENAKAELLNFNKVQGPFLRRVFYNQSIAGLKEVEDLTDQQRVEMSHLYSQLNYHYYQGTAYQLKDIISDDPAYALWQEEGMASELGDYVQYILTDAIRDYNRVED